MAMMATNLRGRIGGLGDNAVGYYIVLVGYTPADYASPALVRKSITRRPADDRTADVVDAPEPWLLRRGHL